MGKCDHFNFLITLCHLHERVKASGPHLGNCVSIEDENDPQNCGSSSMHVICVFNNYLGSNNAGVASWANQFINELDNDRVSLVFEHVKSDCACACSHGA